MHLSQNLISVVLFIRDYLGPRCSDMPSLTILFSRTVVAIHDRPSVTHPFFLRRRSSSDIAYYWFWKSRSYYVLRQLFLGVSPDLAHNNDPFYTFDVPNHFEAFNQIRPINGIPSYTHTYFLTELRPG